MNEEEAAKLVAKKFGGQAVPIPRHARFRAWVIEVLHPLVHHRVRHVVINTQGVIIDQGWVCRLCWRPM